MDIISTIQACGARKEMVYITYEGQERLVEPYSFRDGGLQFFAWCRMLKNIRSFTVTKITAARPSGLVYGPRYPVEF
ncbi:WYL domain-containing protein [Aneurinibacillus migulanus]|uniref:WYL domain-containing protein n=1 Tax=Aneurinibacillus migulanus TaxID=47500 RepID=A0A0D1WJR3_ANEMI|nr:hypothetical protein [Aneurinibacillus migulanus]KIV58860.1 hypothetical protein TS65_05815 [Aneurinibacillus migulanus]KON96553.1 hypothetical protein AF333_14805 [Aneurinibacillus migulanus]MED0890768.1 hypothetical protein [Aneurinibacillus migulanus]MED1618279.1 hypothetical protein [Aneurinibacillus migulanus]SDK08382.1 hypothetical protein SAMN04487909_13818 [Aneurinibacillus migulanus]